MEQVSIWVKVKSALVSGFLMAFLAIAGYIIAVGDIFAIDWKLLVNVGVIALLTSIVSLIKAGMTTSSGNFVGAIKVQ